MNILLYIAASLMVILGVAHSYLSLRGVSMLIKMSCGLLIGVLSLPVFAMTDCTTLKGCERKFCDIEQQLDYAREHNNKRQIAGLTKSLENSKKHCTNDSLKRDLVNDIADAKADVADYEKDLAAAEKSGKAKKVVKYQEKIAKKQADINRLEKELAALE